MDIEIVEIILDFLGGVVGALIAILVFVLGERASWKKENHRIKDLEHYLYHTLNDFVNPINKQISALELFIKDLAIETDIAYRPELITSLNSDNITWISHTDRYRIFVTRRKKRHYSFSRS